MDQKLPSLYKEYGQYSNYRNFPLDLDGLKPVERRVLFSAHKIARSKLSISIITLEFSNIYLNHLNLIYSILIIKIPIDINTLST